MERRLDENEINKTTIRYDSEVLKALQAQMKLSNAVNDTLIEFAVSFFLDLELNVTKDEMADILVEYCVRENTGGLPMTLRTVETVAMWYIQEFEYYYKKFPKIGVTDITWLQIMLSRVCKKNFTRGKVYRILEEYPDMNPNKIFNKAIGIKVISYYLESR